MEVRGIRNNNPLNIIKSSSNHWVGEISGADQVFCTFSSMVYGVRAAFCLYRRYIQRGFSTPAKLISRWAPASENATWKYIRAVCSRTSMSAGDVLSFSDGLQMRCLFQAMCWVECGQELDDDIVLAGWRLAINE